MNSTKKKEFFVAKFNTPFAAEGASVCVEVQFTGKVQTNMAGFYKSAYTKNGVAKNMLSTQLRQLMPEEHFRALTSQH